MGAQGATDDNGVYASPYNADEWRAIEDVPQAVFDNAAYSMRAVVKGEGTVPMTSDEARAILLALEPWTSVSSDYMDEVQRYRNRKRR